jgi:aldose sugar dehydrogenase
LSVNPYVEILTMKKFLIFAVVALSIVVLVTLYQQRFLNNSSPAPSSTPTEQGVSKPEKVEVIAQNLEIPWSMAFLPNGDLLFTERAGSLKVISNRNVRTISEIEDVRHIGEGGLMGVEVHPDFEQNNFIYIMLTYQGNGNNTLNRVVRYKLANNSLSDRRVIMDNIPGGINHNGGRIKFGPDKFLYVATGDSGEPSLAQDRNSLAGKILRITDNGRAAPGNPFRTEVYSYGHRNPQGLAWDTDGRLWSTEHGRSAPTGYDEVNIIIAGKNYGWPEIQGDQKRSGMESPLAQSGNDTWAPAGAAFYQDKYFFTGLRGRSLYELTTENGNAVITRHFNDEFGRIRDVILGNDGLLYIATSNLDGRGTPKENDDKIIRIDPSQL